jgi:hypothetical protein
MLNRRERRSNRSGFIDAAPVLPPRVDRLIIGQSVESEVGFRARLVKPSTRQATGLTLWPPASRFDRNADDAEAVGFGLQGDDRFADQFFERDAEPVRAVDDVVAVDLGGERLVFHLLADGRHLDAVDALVGPDERDRYDEAGKLVNGDERLFHRRNRLDAAVVGVAQDRPQDFFAPTVVAQPGDADERMASRAQFQIRVPFVVEIVQEADGAPKVFVGARAAGEMPHASRDGFAMLAQAFGFDPFIQNRAGAFRPLARGRLRRVDGFDVAHESSSSMFGRDDTSGDQEHIAGLASGALSVCDQRQTDLCEVTGRLLTG